MNPNLAERILALPEDVRKKLAEVPGPGWEVTRGAFLGGGHGTTETRPLARCGADVSDRYAWWPANPAAAVRAVFGCGLYRAYSLIAGRMFVWMGDDNEAAVALIERSLPYTPDTTAHG